MANLQDLPSILLYVPFNHDYIVPYEVQKKLTEAEFFSPDSCFVNVDFDEEINRIRSSQLINIDDSFDEEVDRSNIIPDADTILSDPEAREEIRRLEECKTRLYLFNRWINYGGRTIYRIIGDAGTGKSTYLHYLAYTNKNKNLAWKIIDLSRSHSPVRILSEKIFVNNFEALEGKVIAALLRKIFDTYFYADKLDIKRNVYFIANNISKLYFSYKNIQDDDFPPTELKWFFENSGLYNYSNVEAINKSSLNRFEKGLAKEIQKMLDQQKPATIIAKLWDIYTTILKCIDSKKKYIIAFDNIERFIGRDEIYNTKIVEFVNHMQDIMQAHYERDEAYDDRFQVLMLMRNTSVKMFSPIHFSDFEEHELNLTAWFPIDRIISKKIKWYSTHKIQIGDSEYESENHTKLIERLIGKNNFDGCSPYSLQQKLEKLFNHNNRVMVSMIIRAIHQAKTINPQIISFLNSILENTSLLGEELTRFAARSIVIRLILDVLKSDKLFEYLNVQKKPGDNREKLGYSRKILTILHSYAIEEKGYMPFDYFIEKLLGNSDDIFDINNAELLDTLSSILFYMNYYDVKEQNWLHFIDIQCNLNGYDSLSVKNPSEFKQLILQHHNYINLKIMNAGSAYLQYIVHSFEYFSCRTSGQYHPPLLSVIPSLSDLQNKDIEAFSCTKCIKATRKETLDCIQLMERRAQARAIDFEYKKNRDSHSLSHTQRILFAHTGFINNFSDCIINYYSEFSLSDKESSKLQALLLELNSIRDSYPSDIISSSDNEDAPPITPPITDHGHSRRKKKSLGEK